MPRRFDSPRVTSWFQISRPLSLRRMDGFGIQDPCVQLHCIPVIRIFAEIGISTPIPRPEISQISIGGYRKLYDMGVYFRYKYRHLYTDNTPFQEFANEYPASPRVVDSARWVEFHTYTGQSLIRLWSDSSRAVSWARIRLSTVFMS